MKLWFTAQELADASCDGLMAGLPTTKRGINELARRDGWEWHKGLCRTRAGREGGGGLEYHLDVLPAPVRLAWLSRHVAVDGRAPKVSIPDDTPISTRGRQARDARLVILGAADRYRESNQLSVAASDAYFATLYNAGEIEIAPWARVLVKRLSRRTLARWRAAGSAALAYDPGASRKGTGILSRGANGEIRDFVLALLGKNPFLSTEHIRNAVIDRFGLFVEVNGVRRRLPSLRAFQFALTDLRREFKNELTRLTDPDGYRSKVEFVATGTSTANRLNEVWQIDASPLDAIMLSGKRQTIYAAVDVYSRRTIITMSPTPRASAVGLLLRKCLLEWGVPERIKTDNGSDFIAHSTRRLLDVLNIEIELAPPYTPRAKAIVERAIGTFQRDFAATLPGFVGHSVADRKVIEGRKAFSRRLGLDDAHLFDADMTEAEAEDYANSWAAEIFAHTPHDGLGGRTPFEVAAGFDGPVRRIENEAALDILLAPVAGGNGLRQVTKTGIRVDGANYLIGTVMPGTTVLCRMDPSDLGRLFVFAADGESFLGHAVCPQLRGLDPIETAARVKAEQKAYLDGRLKPIRAQMRRIGPRQVADAQLNAARARTGNLISFPRPSEAHSTPALGAAAAAVAGGEATPLSAEASAQHETIKAEYGGAAEAIVRRLPETPQQRLKRALEIERRLQAGEDVPADDAHWLGGYQAGPEYRAMAVMLSDFGDRMRL